MGTQNQSETTLKGLDMCAANPYRVDCERQMSWPRVVAALQPLGCN